MDKYLNIPESLRQRGLFCCWRYEGRGGRKTKIPYNPATGQRAQTNNPCSFVDFVTAKQMVQNYDGIGFLITDGLFVIDCDHCKSADGSLTQTAADIVELFSGAYVEWSPSGEGLHIIGYALDFAFDKQKYWMNKRVINVEVYISGATNRFMTLTGNVYRAGELLTCTDKLQVFLDNYMQRNNSALAAPTSVPVGDSFLTDDEVITKATYARNGAVFQKLWSGDYSGYASQSEADLALAGVLVFWCGKDIAQMDRLFRASGLFREKWDRVQTGSTYGRITLEKAAIGSGRLFADYLFSGDCQICAGAQAVVLF
ncbi:MAG: hypothetical protein LBJ12_02405 [Oscillospiraceae bacterium]|jgi:putative DNA primase/helicase|nr:hypothetical protein [Oscillospiraceae bacterium]